MLVAMVNLAVVEFDLEGRAVNPFKTMDLTRKDAPVEAEGTKREPLPEEVIRAMRERVRDRVKEPALALIWRLLQGTGCRVSHWAVAYCGGRPSWRHRFEPDG